MAGYSQNNFFWSHTVPPAELPTILTTAVTSITETTAISGGNVTYDGGATITNRGICWNTAGTPITSDSHVHHAAGTGAYIDSLASLTGSTLYYVRAFAINSVGTAYGNQEEFTTASSGTLPTVTTNDITDIGTTTATGGGNVTSDGGYTVTDRGICWKTGGVPRITDSHTHNSSGTGAFTSSLTGLTSCIIYYVRAYATSSKGTAYGTVKTFSADLSGGLEFQAISGYFDGTGSYNTTDLTSSEEACYKLSHHPTSAGWGIGWELARTTTMTVGQPVILIPAGTCQNSITGYYIYTVGGDHHNNRIIHITSGVLDLVQVCGVDE